MELKEDDSCSIQKSPSPSGITFFKNVLYIGYSLFYWLTFFYIGPIIAVARVGRTGAWDNDPVDFLDYHPICRNMFS